MALRTVRPSLDPHRPVARSPERAAAGAAIDPLSIDPDVAALQVLLRIERDARRAGTVAALHHLAANETRKLVRGRQFFVLAIVDGKPRVAAVSSVTAVDREAPFIQWVEALLARRFVTPPAAASVLDLSDEPATVSDHAEHYPFPHLLVLPMVGGPAGRGEPLGVLLAARETPWDEEGLRVGERLAECYAHAWSAFRPRPSPLRRLRRPGAMAGLALGGFVLLGLTPTHLTALAPFEIVPDRPFVVAASSDGTIESVAVRPNTAVAAGQVLYTCVSTTLRDNLEIAERAVAVAEAKWKQYRQGAFVDPQAKRELASAEAEYQLKLAERDYAKDLVDKSVTRAPRAGIVLFNDANDLAGRPVQVGQRIMEIADRAHVLARINVPVDDSIVLAEGARAKMFLDSDPLHAVEGSVVHASHGARVTEGNALAYRVDASLAPDAAVPRLGVRGTAEIYGPRSSLLLVLFRRPLGTLRQHYGF